MNCRHFESQMPDWLGGRLPAERSLQMAAHRERCASCARAAQAEELLRGIWREAPPPVPDAWPRLAARLVAEEPRPTWTWTIRTVSPRRWALGGAALLAAFGSCWLFPSPIGMMSRGPHRDAPVGMTTSAAPLEASGPAVTAWSALSETSQVNPAVDDPVGTNMENVWAHLDTSGQ